jgi:hypothetical protein
MVSPRTAAGLPQRACLLVPLYQAVELRPVSAELSRSRVSCYSAATVTGTANR